MHRGVAVIAMVCFTIQVAACGYTKTIPVNDELASNAPEITSDGLSIAGYATRDGNVHEFKGKVVADGDEFIFRPAMRRDLRARNEVWGEPSRVPQSEVDRFMVHAIHVGRTIGLGIGIVAAAWAVLFVTANSGNESWD